MKKLSLLLVFVGLVAFSSFGQRIGVKAGLNMATVAMDGDVDTKMLPGIHLGAVAEFEFSENLAFEPGLLFSQKGTDYDVDGDMKTRLSYLDIPLNLRYKMGNFFAQAGPQIGIGLSGTQEFGDEEEDIEFGSDDDQLKRLDFALSFGVGMNFNQFQVSANYGLGLANLSNWDDDDLKNRVISVSLGYYF